MKILVVDGQGGKLGTQIIKLLMNRYDDIEITAIGTNSAATQAMIKAGAKNVASGENPLIVACRKSDVIIGPVGIVIADALLGEITPAMAVAVAQSNAVRILIPVNRCENIVAGVPDLAMPLLVEDAVAKFDEIKNKTLDK